MKGLAALLAACALCLVAAPSAGAHERTVVITDEEIRGSGAAEPLGPRAWTPGDAATSVITVRNDRPATVQVSLQVSRGGDPELADALRVATELPGGGVAEVGEVSRVEVGELAPGRTATVRVVVELPAEADNLTERRRAGVEFAIFAADPEPGPTDPEPGPTDPGPATTVPGTAGALAHTGATFGPLLFVAALGALLAGALAVRAREGKRS